MKRGDRAKCSRVQGVPWDPAGKAHFSHSFDCMADVVREESHASNPTMKEALIQRAART